MMRRGALLSLGFLAVVACNKPPPKPAPAPEVTSEPAHVPPAAPKKCDALDEGCVAAEGTRSPIQASSWTLEPPASWTYAHEGDATVAKTDGAIVAVVVHETGPKKGESANRSAAFDSVVKKLALTMPKKAPWPDKPAKVLTVGAAKVSLFQFDGVTREGKPGALLAFTSRLSDKESLLGAGFVLDSDTKDADKAILKCVQSLRGPDPAAAAPDAGAKPK
ncbi:MAG: hypothetical protein JNL38_39430 [Myxococcales bacterium]|jgi:hypothetical protein|nr:hypothetical protein [Myxococcales bacterium]